MDTFLPRKRDEGSAYASAYAQPRSETEAVVSFQSEGNAVVQMPHAVKLFTLTS